MLAAARPALAWSLAAAVSGASFAVAAALAVAVSDGSEIAYLLGGWAAPWGIEYRIDALNALVLVIVTGASTVTLVQRPGSASPARSAASASGSSTPRGCCASPGC